MTCDCVGIDLLQPEGLVSAATAIHQHTLCGDGKTQTCLVTGGLLCEGLLLFCICYGPAWGNQSQKGVSLFSHTLDIAWQKVECLECVAKSSRGSHQEAGLPAGEEDPRVLQTQRPEISG